MNDGTRRTLLELITLHELEPELSEVITEGRADAGVILWFLRRHGSNAAVYSIADRLEVPPSEVKRHGQNVGNKGRVIAAALTVLEASSTAAEKVTFVYDIDDDVLLGRNLSEDVCLLHTDYRSIDMYGFAKNPIDKLLKVTLRATDDLKPDEILNAISDPLVSIAITRLILSRVKPSVALIDAFEKKCTIKGDSVAVNIGALIADSLNGAGGARSLGVSRDELFADFERAKTAAQDTDIRLIIRGHDFTQVCCHYLRTRYPYLFREDRAPYRVLRVFEVALRTCLEMSDLEEENLFKSILRRHGKLQKVA